MAEILTAPKEIMDLVEQFDSNYDSYKSLSYNEEDIKIDFINRFFEVLGWDVGNKNNKPPELREVKFEDSVEVQGRIKNPDYSFRLDRTRKFFVEAKKPAVNIEQGINPAFQLRSYAWSATLPLSIVTDFEEFAVYDCRNEPSKLDKPSKSRLLIIKYYEYEKRWDEIASLFSKEAVQNGSIDIYLDSIPSKRGSKKVDEALLEDISGWRDALAVNIAKMNPALDQKSLNHAVQMTIDRILFLRICEDRAIEDYGRLKKLLDGETVYSRLFGLFEDADKRYNSGLFHFHSEVERKDFDTITPAIKIEDKVLQQIIRGLYYPDCPYVFSEIPAEILGHVYEQFLGKVIQLNEKHEVQIEYKPEVRKAGGVYYTPSYIVDYIVKNTVGKLLDGKTPKEASELRILDPACGSGSFLIGAYQYILDWHLDWYKSNLVPLLDSGQKLTSKEVQALLPFPIEKPDKNAKARSKRIWERASVFTLPIEQRAEEWHLRTAERKRILLNNIYGVDIDTQAVEVTKLSLQLKVLEGENKTTIADLSMYSDERALPDLGNNIKCGNSLIGWDILEDNPGLAQEAIQRINPFDWDREYPEIFQRGGFDAVIGNPPYVRQEGLSELKAYFQRHYAVYHGTADLYTYFIERGVSLLKDGGFFSYIVANKWMRANYGQPLRKWLKEQCIEEIIDFGDLPVFLGATTYPCIIRIIKKAHQEHFNVTQVSSLDFQSLHNYVNENQYRVDQLNLDDRGWSLADDRTQALLAKICSKGVPLGEYVGGKIYRGVLTGLNEAFVIDNATRERLIAEDPKSAELIKPFFVGRDIKRYERLQNGRYLILMPKGWTRNRSDSAKDAFGWLTENYPAITSHLLPFEEAAQKRYDKGEYWWELRACDYYEEFERPKLIYAEIATRGQFAYDDCSGFSDTTTYIIGNDSRYLLGILNSRIWTFLFSKTSSEIRGGFFRWKYQYMSPLPIRKIDRTDPTDIARRDRIVSLVDQMLTLHKQLQEARTPHEQTALQRQIEATDRQIDALVYELYGLTEEEIRIVEGGKNPSSNP